VEYRLRAARFAHSYFRKLSLSHPQSFDAFLSGKSVLDVAEWALLERDWLTMFTLLRVVQGEPGVSLTRGSSRARAAQGGVTLGPEQGEFGANFCLGITLEGIRSRVKRDISATKSACYIIGPYCNSLRIRVNEHPFIPQSESHHHP